jgi:translocator protein
LQVGHGLAAVVCQARGAGMGWFILTVWFVLCFAVAGIGGRWTAPEIKGWYGTLRRPAFAPPNWVFGPVWTLLYALMALAAWLISLAPPSSMRTVALGLFVVQLALNLAWSWIFFKRHRIGAAVVEIAALWAMIGMTAIAFGQIEGIAGWLLAPYWAWVSFAAVLNWDYWRLNREA